jgi:hypothetical protein
MRIFGRKRTTSESEAAPTRTRVPDPGDEEAPEHRAADFSGHLDLIKAELDADEPGWQVHFVPPAVAFLVAPGGTVAAITEAEYPTWESPEAAAEAIRGRIRDKQNA